LYAPCINKLLAEMPAGNAANMGEMDFFSSVMDDKSKRGSPEAAYL